MLTRSEVSSRHIRVLHRGGWGNPDVMLVEAEAGPVVVKDFGARGGRLRRALGRRMIAREERAYRRLSGVSAVPRLLGRVDDQAIILEYRPGELLSRSLKGRLPAPFLGELADAIAQMHGRGVVHLDLRHRSNILAGQDGRPVLIDFGSAIRFEPATASGRFIRRSLAWIDRAALRKWQRKLDP